VSPKANKMHLARKYTAASGRVLADHVYHRALGHRRPIIYRQAAGIDTVALTFDDGPSPASTPHILRELDRIGAKATFFLSGVRVAMHPSLAGEIVAAGHAVYGHGWEHINHEETGAADAVEAMERVETLLAGFRATPSTYLIRLPYNAGYQRGWMHRAMRDFHSDIRFASWSFSTRDWLLAQGCGDLAAVEKRCNRVAQQIGNLPNLPGSILLLHEDPFGASGALSASVARLLLPPVLERVIARGCQLEVVRAEATRASGEAWRGR
jgi:peptidoglycan/xylan/chitin deacetylase (PgdA/CDA1 family)